MIPQRCRSKTPCVPQEAGSRWHRHAGQRLPGARAFVRSADPAPGHRPDGRHDLERGYPCRGCTAEASRRVQAMPPAGDRPAPGWRGAPSPTAGTLGRACAPIPTTADPGRAEQTRPRASRSFVQWRAPPGRPEPRPLHGVWVDGGRDGSWGEWWAEEPAKQLVSAGVLLRTPDARVGSGGTNRPGLWLPEPLETDRYSQVQLELTSTGRAIVAMHEVLHSRI